MAILNCSKGARGGSSDSGRHAAVSHTSIRSLWQSFRRPYGSQTQFFRRMAARQCFRRAYGYCTPKAALMRLFGYTRGEFTMRIGLFTDTYRPSVNGITYVVESLKEQLTSLGHEVYIFCPGGSIRPSKQPELIAEDDHIMRFPSVRSGFFDEFDISLFLPRRVVEEIGAMELDIIHVFTPSQIGLLGINAALTHDIPLVIQHCTDIYEFVEHYPAVLPGALALIGIVLPMNIKLTRDDVHEIARLYRPRSGVTMWNRVIIEKTIAMLYSKADVVIALCQKSYTQLASWQSQRYRFPLVLMPNGVDALPRSTSAEQQAFRDQWNIRKSDEVFGFVGRLGEEKNLPVLIKAFDHVGKARPNAKLLFVGDFDYRETLEAMAAASRYPDRIVFTGRMPREQLDAAYANFDVFVFPSLKDTQGWVLHEAAHARLPIVLIDRQLSEVAYDGINALFANNNATDVARKVRELLGSPTKRAAFGAESKRLAARFTGKKQIKKLEVLYRQTISQHDSLRDARHTCDSVAKHHRNAPGSIRELYHQMVEVAAAHTQRRDK